MEKLTLEEESELSELSESSFAELVELSDREFESLSLEYKETIQTLRNWDTIFSNWFSSLLIGGGVGTVVSFAGKQSDVESLNISLKIVVSAVIIVALMLGMGYLIYANRIALPKKKLLKLIEQKLRMQGSYLQVGDRAAKTVYILLLFPFTIVLFLLYCLWRM